MPYKLKIITAILLLLTNFAAAAYPGGTAQISTESVAQVVITSMKYQVFLYALCAFYNSRFNRWPKNKEELLGAFKTLDKPAGDSIRAMVDSKQSPWSLAESIEKEVNVLSKSFNFRFRQLFGGAVLIEGSFNEQITDNIVSFGMNRCLFSTIGRKTKEGFSFIGSDKNKDNRDFMSAAVEFNLKK